MSKFEHRSLYILPDEVAPDWETRRELAAAVRKLSERCVLSDVGEEALAQAKSLVEQAAALLPPGSTASEAFVNGSYAKDPSVYVDRGAMMGRSNRANPGIT